MPSGLLIFWSGPSLIEGVTSLILLLSCFIEISAFKANFVDPNQMPLSAVSDLGLHTQPVFLLWDTRHKWANI